MYVLLVVLLNVLLCQAKTKTHSSPEEDDDDVFGTNLVAQMRNDANLDLPVDEEYEDLRAELLAYHTALATLSSNSMRRSMASTPCWSLGGICVDHKLCTGFRYLTEVPGCKDKFKVCCFAWNEFKVKDHRDKGLSNIAFPWSEQKEIGGLGVIDIDKKPNKIKKKKKKGAVKSLNLPLDDIRDFDHVYRNRVDQDSFTRNGLENSNNTKIIALILKASK